MSEYPATTHFGKIPSLPLDEGQFIQVIVNLLTNAAHAVKGGGDITVVTWLDEGQVVVTVSDTGHGIGAQHVPKLFDPFFTTKPVGEGTGLGLTICRDIIKNHNGTLLVQSEVNNGTVFEIRLPVPNVESSKSVKAVRL